MADHPSVPTPDRPLVSLWQGKWLSPVLIRVSIMLNLTQRRLFDNQDSCIFVQGSGVESPPIKTRRLFPVKNRIEPQSLQRLVDSVCSRA